MTAKWLKCWNVAKKNRYQWFHLIARKLCSLPLTLWYEFEEDNSLLVNLVRYTHTHTLIHWYKIFPNDWSKGNENEHGPLQFNDSNHHHIMKCWRVCVWVPTMVFITIHMNHEPWTMNHESNGHELNSQTWSWNRFFFLVTWYWIVQ